MAVLYEMKTDNATVRIHSGKMTNEEWQENFRRSAVEFFNTIRPDLERLGLIEQVFQSPNVNT